MCRYRSLLFVSFALGSISRFRKIIYIFLVSFSANSLAGYKVSQVGYETDCYTTQQQACLAIDHQTYSGNWTNPNGPCRLKNKSSGQVLSYPLVAISTCTVVCDIATAQSAVDAANAESGGPETFGPFAKPASGTGLHVSVGYQTENYCLNGCQATRLTTQDVSEDAYSYAISLSESLYVQNASCGGSSGIPPYQNQQSINDYYIPPTAVRDVPPIRDPNSPPPNYPPTAPPPPDQPPPPPIDDDPPPPPPPQECLGAGCEPPPVEPPTGPPPEVPPFQEIITEPWACQFIDCHPPPKATPPDTAVPTSESGGLPEPEPSGGCPSGTSWGSKNGVNGCYGQPSNGGQCGQGQYWGEVDGKEGCYGATVCKDGQVYGSIGDSDPKCYDLGSCYVKGDCNQECDPETETCDSLKGQFSKDCKVTPECGDADAIECAILRQSWVTSCDAVKTAGDISDCNTQFKCENDPVQCAIAKMHRDNICALTQEKVTSDMETAFQNLGFSKVEDFTDDDIFTERDGNAIVGDFLNADSRSGSCPPDLVIPIMGNQIAVPMTIICQYGGYVRVFILISASFLGLMMFYRSFVNS
ncbi:hypothetical protein [Zhongshania sp. BJYM1]|uniref:hypothetical protein n=1 Tax=Zhongshania aquatica TaxID=2965069 RepID=UPI0022B51654|nr:hypothetical protein [Marortus sp. BJYM1]